MAWAFFVIFFSRVNAPDKKSTLAQVMACCLAITCVILCPDLCCHVAPLGQNELIHPREIYVYDGTWLEYIWVNQFREIAQFLFYFFKLHGPLTRYIKMRVADAPGMPGTFSPPPWVSDPNSDFSGGENVPGIPGAWADSNFTYLARGPLSG